MNVPVLPLTEVITILQNGFFGVLFTDLVNLCIVCTTSRLAFCSAKHLLY